MKTKGNGAVGTLRVLRQDNDRNYEVEIAVMRSGVNRNRWDYRNVKEFSNTFRGTPILCAYVDGQIGDGHNMKQTVGPDGKKRYSFTGPTAERIVGTIYDGPEAVWTEERNGETWVMARGKLWRFYHPELVDKIARQGRMEVSAETDIKEQRQEDGVEIFDAWVGLGVTILGDRVDPAIPGANIKAFAALQAEFKDMKLKAASASNQNENKKGVRPLRLKSKKALMKELSSKFEGCRILAVSDDGAKVLMLNAEFVPCAYEFRDEDHGVIIPERIVPVPLPIAYAFNDTDKVELDACELIADLSREAAEQADHTAKECETVKTELADCKAQLAAMAERENARRTHACEEAVKAELTKAVKTLSVADDLAQDILEDVSAGKYMNSMDAEGNWIGDKLAVSALMAKIGLLQLEAAEAQHKPTRYAWEGGFAPNSDQSGSIEAAIARILG